MNDKAHRAEQSPSKRRLLGALIILLSLAAILLLLRKTVLAPKILEVEVAPVRLGRVESTVSNTRAGSVKLRRRAGISPQIGGRVIELPIHEGQRVHARDLLLRLDDSVQAANLELARTSAATAKAQAKEACLAADQADRDLQRTLDLEEQGITSESTREKLQSQRDQSHARCQASRARLKEAGAGIRVAQAQLGLTILRAPFDGIVGEVSTEVGEWVTPSPPGLQMPPIIDLLDPASVYISAPIDEMDAERVRSGQPARISVDSRDNVVFPGHIVRVAPFVQDVVEQNRTIEVEAEFDNPTLVEGLLPGVSADLEIILDAHDNVLKVPTLSVSNSTEVFVFSEGKLYKRIVQIGLSNWSTTEIVDGLKEGELVVTSRSLTAVSDGAPARIKNGTD